MASKPKLNPFDKAWAAFCDADDEWRPMSECIAIKRAFAAGWKAVDVILLACDGAWRSGHEPEEIATAMAEKLAINEQRTWPDWRTMPEDRAIEHERI